MTIDQAKDLALTVIGATGLTALGKIIWTLVTRKPVLRQLNASASKAEAAVFEMPFLQATEILKLLRQDLDDCRKRLRVLENENRDLARKLDECMRHRRRAGGGLGAGQAPTP